MSIPMVTQQQIDAMNKVAQEKMQKDGIKHEEVHQQDPVQATQVQEDVVVSDTQNDVSQETNSQDYQESADQPSKIEETAYAAPAETSKEANLRFLRERAEKAERERDELMRYAMSMQQPKQQQAPQQTPEENLDLEVDDDALIEGRHVKQLAQEIVHLKKMIKQNQLQSKKTEVETMEMRLQNQYPDFHQVVTRENLVKLRQLNPDLADSILNNPDQYRQAKLAYDMVKQFGIVKNNARVVEQAVAKKNINKPRPSASIAPTQSESPISKVNAFAHGELTKDVKRAHYEEMLQAMKGI